MLFDVVLSFSIFPPEDDSNKVSIPFNYPLENIYPFVKLSGNTWTH